jgi:gamma-D-glutamyl-L-lysine dipeptidyl-peptidase
MRYGISGLSLIPVRREPSERSEMVTQILFGEHFEILEYLPGWCHIVMAFDGYQGWVDQKMITHLSERHFHKITKSAYAVTTDIFTPVPVSRDQYIMLVAGSTLPVWRPYLREFSLEGEAYAMTGNVACGKVRDPRTLIINQAIRYFNAPYLWGGRSPFGIDCSGLTQVIYKMAGITLPRDAGQQVHRGSMLSFIEETQPGDLAFFDDEEGRIIHVGIIWKQGKIIHASGKVRIDNVDQYGIFNAETRKYTHRMRVIKKIL